MFLYYGMATEEALEKTLAPMNAVVLVLHNIVLPYCRMSMGVLVSLYQGSYQGSLFFKKGLDVCNMRVVDCLLNIF